VSDSTARYRPFISCYVDGGLRLSSDGRLDEGPKVSEDHLGHRQSTAHHTRHTHSTVSTSIVYYHYYN